MNTESTCPICGNQSNARFQISCQFDAERLIQSVSCGHCGKFRIREQNALEIRTWDASELKKISALVREQSMRLRDVPLNLYLDVKENWAANGPVALLNELTRTRWPEDPIQRLDRVLANLGRLSRSPGETISYSEEDTALFFAMESSEVHFDVKYLEQLNFVEMRSGKCLVVTIPGLAHLRALERQKATIDSSDALIAMHFTPEMESVYTAAIEPAVTESGYNPVKSNNGLVKDSISEWILASIRRSRFVIADFTGNRPNVYFEAGFAKGLGIDVIWSCKREYLKELHFDTRQFDHILWDSPEELRTRLKDRIGYWIGKGSANQ